MQTSMKKQMKKFHPIKCLLIQNQSHAFRITKLAEVGAFSLQT